MFLFLFMAVPGVSSPYDFWWFVFIHKYTSHFGLSLFNGFLSIKKQVFYKMFIVKHYYV